MHFGFKPYLNMVFMAILPVAFALSGNMLRGLRSKVGLAWIGFLIFAAFSIPFSYWRSGSASLLEDFAWRSISLFFLICAFSVSFRQCKRFMYANIAVAFLVLISTIAFSDYNGGRRLGVADSFLLANSNDLAMHLLLDIGFLLYLALQRNNLKRFAGGVGMIGCLYYLLKTGSRGGVVALAVFLVVLFVFSRNKVIWAAVSIPALAGALVLVPANTLHRFTMILANPDVTQAVTEEDGQAIESQQERQVIMKKALHYIAARPLTGVGPGEFMDAVWSDEHREGKHPPALGTHNTYLEVASECGLPAFFCYAGVMIACIVVNYRTLKRALQWKELEDRANMAYCMLAVCSGFAVNILFHHMTYTPYLPILSGLTVCLAASLPASSTQTTHWALTALRNKALSTGVVNQGIRATKTV